MSYNIVPAAFIITLLVIALISVFSRRPLRGLWLFFILIFLATWAGQLWIHPFGPVTWGISWISLLAVSIFFGVLLLAVAPPMRKSGDPVDEDATIALGTLLWIVLLLLIISIAVGYYRLPNIAMLGL